MYNYKDINILNMKAKFYAKELWNEEIDIPIKQNNRLSRHLGWYKRTFKNDEEIADCIEIAGYVLKNKYKELTVDSILIHEMCHWYSHKHNLNNYDFSKEFCDLVTQSGGSVSHTVKPVLDIHYGYCSKCNEEKRLYKYEKGKRYSCLKDGTKIEYRRMEEILDTYEPNEKLIDLNNKFKEYYKNMYKLYA